MSIPGSDKNAFTPVGGAGSTGGSKATQVTEASHPVVLSPSGRTVQTVQTVQGAAPRERPQTPPRLEADTKDAPALGARKRKAGGEVEGIVQPGKDPKTAVSEGAGAGMRSSSSSLTGEEALARVDMAMAGARPSEG